jgi:hypothetical protein
MTDRFLDRRIGALEKRVERIEMAERSGHELVLERIAEFRRFMFDRFDRLDRRLEAMAERGPERVQAGSAQVIALVPARPPDGLLTPAASGTRTPRR